jgi:hypothetical protein
LGRRYNSGGRFFSKIPATTQMSGELQRGPETLAEPTEARFTIRALFIAMAIVAILAALVGPIVRHLSAEVQTRLLLLWGGWSLVAVAWLGYLAFQRRESERLAGNTLLRLPMFDEQLPYAGPYRRRLNIALMGLFTLFMIFGMSESAVVPPSVPFSPYVLFNFGFMGIWCVWWISRVVTSFWWRKEVRFAERGILWDRRVMFWDHVTKWCWDTNRPDFVEVSGIDQHQRDMSLKILVPTEHRSALATLIENRIVEKPNVPIVDPYARFKRESLTPAERDARITKNLVRSLPAIAFVLVAIWFFHAGLSGIREFDESIVFGLLLTPIGQPLLRWRRVSQAGPPIIRLTTGARWLPALVLAGAAYGVYCAARTWGPTSASIGYMGGFLFGALVGAVPNVFTSRSFDLRSNGVFIAGDLWPWTATRLLRWDHARGKLVIGNRWRRIRANVRPALRDAVDEVLREKLGHSTPMTDGAPPVPFHDQQ